MNKKRIRTLMISMIVLCISCTAVVGGTYALFSDSDTVSNHLSAGKLEISLDRVAYSEYVLAANGTMTNGNSNTDREDLVKNNDVLFNIVNAVPTSWYQSTLEIKNEGDTAYDYDVRIKWNEDGEASALETEFAKQIRITITSSKINNQTHSTSFMLFDCADHVVSLGYMLKGADPETFTIKAEFVDNDDNNDAMRATLSFDVLVSASQKVSV